MVYHGKLEARTLKGDVNKRKQTRNYFKAIGLNKSSLYELDEQNINYILKQCEEKNLDPEKFISYYYEDV